jgi:hypothetical protein
VRRRRALLGAAGLLTTTPSWLRAQERGPVFVEIWKSPTCGCCKEWVTHLEAAGFRVKVHDVGNAAARTRLQVPEELGSCHTAWVGRYAIEGHVPAQDIRRLLAQAPDAIGLAAPGMPIGSPGMDGPAHGPRRDRYDVLLIGRNGGTTVFSTHS